MKCCFGRLLGTLEEVAQYTMIGENQQLVTDEPVEFEK
jgi:hypothetical protein